MIKLVNNKMKSFAFLVIWGSLVVSSLMSISIFYPSPYSHSFNWAVSYSELDGVNWFLSYANESNSEILSEGISPIFRYRQALYGINNTLDHNSELISSINESTYMILSMEYLENIYKNLLTKLVRFNHTDFIIFKEDCSVDKIYTNKYLGIYYIKK